jgi:hypothetical protein
MEKKQDQEGNELTKPWQLEQEKKMASKFPKIQGRDCVRYGVPIAALHRCHACDYEQDGIYNDERTKYLLGKSGYRLAILFYPHLMSNDFRLFREYAADIRGKLVTYSGRRELSDLTEGRRDGWNFNAWLG